MNHITTLLKTGHIAAASLVFGLAGAGAQRLGWYGYVPGAKPSFYHSWYLEPEGTMCHVVMDEAGVGKDAAGLRKSDETLMHRGHELWLATLKWVAEAK